MSERSNRLLWTIVALLVLAAPALWGAGALPWLAERDARGTLVSLPTGSDLVPALEPLALLALAAVAAVLAVGGWVRRVVGVVVAVLGVAAVSLSVTPHHVDLAAGRSADVPHAALAGWTWAGPVLGTLAGLLLVLAGVLVVTKAGALVRLGARYQTPAAARKTEDPDKELWRRLSEGEDPTADDASGPGARS